MSAVDTAALQPLPTCRRIQFPSAVLVFRVSPFQKFDRPAFGVWFYLTNDIAGKDHLSQRLNHIGEHPAVFSKFGHHAGTIKRNKACLVTHQMADGRIGISQEDLWVVPNDLQIDKWQKTNRVVAADRGE